jgi:hypothetical protein
MRTSTILALIVLSMLTSRISYSQDYSQNGPTRLFAANQVDAIVFVGALPTYVADKATVDVPPVSAGLSYMVSPIFGVDFLIGHSISTSSKHFFTDQAYATWTNALYFAAIRPAIHFTKRDNIDIYGGMSMGFHYSKMTGNPGGDLSTLRLSEYENHLGIKSTWKPAFSGFLGARYALSPNLTINSEIGFNVSILSIGLGYRLK